MIRSLLVGFFIATSGCVAAPAQPAYADRPVQQNYIARELAQLQQQLTLTPDQTTSVKAAMEAVVHGDAKKTVGQVLYEICSPWQFATWQQMILASERADAVAAAANETHAVDEMIILTPKQKPQVQEAFYQIELADRTFHLTWHTEVELNAHLDQLAVTREKALDQILTPEQLAKRTQLAQAHFTEPLPDLPALSPNLTLTTVPNRYSWSDAYRHGVPVH